MIYTVKSKYNTQRVSFSRYIESLFSGKSLRETERFIVSFHSVTALTEWHAFSTVELFLQRRWHLEKIISFFFLSSFTILQREFYIYIKSSVLRINARLIFEKNVKMTFGARKMRGFYVKHQYDSRQLCYAR